MIKRLIVFQTLLFTFAFIINCSGKSLDENICKITSIKSFNKESVSKINIEISKERIADLKEFLKGKKYNQELAIFIDFKIPSSKFRFFLYDLKNDKILEKGLVAHGSGSEISGSSELKFSNIENSYQSSLGKYEIANSYVGSFGRSYRLKGLDKTNNLAFKRAIVMHPLSCMQDVEQEYASCLSWGCPMLSQNFFDKVAKYIDASKKPIIMYAFY